ncbi:hypothetical protein C0J45_19823 [Silurus meridionalis]|nr:hypothetical protein C0J45_19823 [Silurus meridionalis]
MEPVLSSALASRTLECVWPRALSASSQADVEQWFNVTLLHYLPYLSSQLISSTQLSGASCLSYRKLVSILGDNYTFAAADFTPADVYSSIKEYLSSGMSKITAATIADTSFPYGFNSMLFDLYLDIDVLQDNLAAITEKVVDTSLQNVILNKLNQIYPSGLNDDVLQLLGSTSRVASIDAISKWNITIIDTLSSLLDSNDGTWEPEKSKAIIMKYLSMDNHSLGSVELNVIGSNICTLDINVLENITAESLMMVLPPDLTSCSIQQKSALFIIAKSSFSNFRSNATTYYRLLIPYLDLKLFENSSAVQSWVSQQIPSELNMLNLGIINSKSNNYSTVITTSSMTAIDTTIPSVNTMTTIINTSTDTNAILSTNASPVTSFKDISTVGTTADTTAPSNTPMTGFEMSTSIGAHVNMSTTSNALLTANASLVTSIEMSTIAEKNADMSATSNFLLTTNPSTSASFEIGTSAETNVNITATSNAFYTTNASLTANIEITTSFPNNSGTIVNMTTISNALITSTSPMTSFEISTSNGANVNKSSTSNDLLTITAFPLTSFETNTGTNDNMSATSNAPLTTTASITTSFEISTSAGTNVTATSNAFYTANASATKNIEITASFQNNSGTSVNMTTANNSLITSASPMTSFDISKSIGAHINMSTISNDLLTTTASPLPSIETNTSPKTNNNMSATSNALLNTTASTNTSFEISTSAGTNVNMSTTSNALRTTTPFPSASFEISTSAVTNVNMSTTSNALLTTTASPLTSIETNTSPETNNNMSATSNALLTTTASTTTSFEISTSAGTNVNTTATSNPFYTANASTTANMEITSSFQNNSGTSVNMTTANISLITSASTMTTFDISNSIGANVNMSTTSNALLTTTASPLTSIETNTPPETNNNMSATSNAPLTTTASTINSFEISTSAGTNVNTTATSNPFYTANASTTANMEITSSFQNNSGTSVNMTTANISLITSASTMTTFDISNSIGANVNMSTTSNALLTTTASTLTSIENNTSPETNNNMSATSNALLTTTASTTTSFEISTSAGTNVNMSTTINALRTTTPFPSASFEISTSAVTNVNMSTTSNALLTTTASPLTSIETNTSPETNNNMSAPSNALLTTTASTATSFEISTSAGTNVNMSTTSNALRTTTPFPSASFEISTSSGTNVNMSTTSNALLTTTASPLTSIETNTPPETNNNMSATSNAPLTTTASTINSFEISTSAGTNVNTTATSNPFYTANASTTANMEITSSFQSNSGTSNTLIASASPMTSFEISTSIGPNLNKSSTSNDLLPVPDFSSTSFETNTSPGTNNNMSATSNAPLTNTPSPSASFEISTSAGTNNNMSAASNAPLTTNASTTASFKISTAAGTNVSISTTSNALLTTISAENTAFTENAIISTTASTILNIKATTLFENFVNITVNPCQNVDSQTFESTHLDGNISALLCNISITYYACSSVTILSTDELAKLLICEMEGSIKYPEEVWKLFFYKFTGPLDEALDRISNMTLSRANADPNILDAIGEVIIKDFTIAQIKNVTFVRIWFLVRFRLFLSSVSTDFLFNLSSKNFSCETYQIVVEALGSQESLMTKKQKQWVFTSFIFPFLSRVDLPDPGCVSSTSGSNDWFEKNLGNFSSYATLKELQILNANFSSVAVFGLLSSEQKAEFILQPDAGVLGNDSVFREVFGRMITSLDLNQLVSFFTAFSQIAIQMNMTSIPSATSDTILNITLMNLAPHFQSFSSKDFALWFQTYLSIFLPVTGPSTLSIIPMNISCNSYREILPGALICNAPGSVFVPFGVEDTQTILTNINKFCSKTNPEITATLVEKFSTVSGPTIQLLGSQSVGLTVGQISSAPYSAISNALPVLGNINGWDQGQANALIQSIISAGFDISGSSSLLSLGTLIEGVPSATISSIPSSQLLSLSQNQKFINNILSAPVILQEAYVQQIITVDQTKVIENVPDALAMYIPVVLLTSVSFVDVSFINNKSWSQEQLTCMYNNIKEGSVNFTDVPSDMLLYYSYDKVQRGNCRSYFTALGRADFSVPSTVLNKPATLFKNAQDCLGISGMSLTRDHVEVLGNMACTLDSSYIYNSDPVILENLKNCGDLSDSQINSVQSLLLSGNTAYGNPSKWNAQTLGQLGILPLYFKSDFWGQFNFDLKKKFLKSFMPFLRDRKTPIQKRRNFFMECNSKVSKVRRAAECTTGYITNMIIADASFPVGYDSTQFDLCLNVTVLQDNLAAITEKVVDPSFLTIILNKLNQIYPSGLTDRVLQLMGPTSRVATISDISNWKITVIDTLSSLMKSDNGNWASEMSKAVIMGYLNMANHTLGSAEINAVGSNICSLDVSVLENITPESLKNAFTLDLSSCSIQQKSALYIIAKSSFSGQNNTYQLIRPYLGGAPVQDIQSLSSQNVSMDITTLLNLDPAVIMALNVSTVQGLLGVNVADLKLFENSTVVRSWVAQQYQQDLNILSIGLTGGNPPSVTSQSSVTTVTTSQTNQTTSSNTTTQGLFKGYGMEKLLLDL